MELCCVSCGWSTGPSSVLRAALLLLPSGSCSSSAQTGSSLTTVWLFVSAKEEGWVHACVNGVIKVKVRPVCVYGMLRMHLDNCSRSAEVRDGRNLRGFLCVLR